MTPTPWTSARKPLAALAAAALLAACGQAPGASLAIVPKAGKATVVKARAAARGAAHLEAAIAFGAARTAYVLQATGGAASVDRVRARLYDAQGALVAEGTAHRRDAGADGRSVIRFAELRAGGYKVALEALAADAVLARGEERTEVGASGTTRLAVKLRVPTTPPGAGGQAALALEVTLEDAPPSASPSPRPSASPSPRPSGSPGPLPSPGPRGAAHARFGIYTGHPGPAKFRDQEALLERQVPLTVRFTDRESWATMRGSLRNQFNAEDGFQQFAGRMRYVETVGLVAGVFNVKTPEGAARGMAELRATARGDHDADFQAIARALVEAGYPDAIIRLGHEFNGTWYGWSAVPDPAAYAAAFRHAHDVMKAVSPRFRFDWCGSRGARNYETVAPQAYPGDDYVDIVGLDFYDRGQGREEWDETTKTWKDPARVWRTHYLPVLEFQRDFARAHGKPVSYPEWGMEQTPPNSQGGVEGPHLTGGDNPTFLRSFHAWLEALPASGPGSLDYHCYYNTQPRNEGNHAWTAFPQAGPLFKQLFGGR